QKPECEGGQHRPELLPDLQRILVRAWPALMVGLLTRFSSVARTSGTKPARRLKRPRPPHQPTTARENWTPETEAPRKPHRPPESPARFRSFRGNRRMPKSAKTAPARKRKEAAVRPWHSTI